MSLKDLNYKPARRTVEIIFDDEVRRELLEARALAKQGDPDAGLGTSPEKRLEAAEAAAEEAAVSFVFQAIPRHRLAEITNAHPPTSEDIDRWKETVKANPFAAGKAPEFDLMAVTPRVIAASLVEPETTEEEVLEMWDEGEWSEAVWGQLAKAAWSVNDETHTVPTFGNGSKKTLTSVPESSTQ
ncbi:MAG: hypothetical protein ACLFVZ_08430 [Actinomycetota bacterium]